MSDVCEINMQYFNYSNFFFPTKKYNRKYNH